MDRFKFRVWEYNTRNCYLKDEKTAIVGDGDLIYGDMISNAMQLAYGEDNPNIIVEQSTGLRDKNGNLIYEGDIVSNGVHEGVVKYGKFNCNCCDGVYGWYFDGCADIRYLEHYEVVGNIHEQRDNK